MKLKVGSLLKVAIAFALIAYVLSQVAWQDRLLPLDGEGLALVGDLEGDWSSESWSFREEGGSTLSASDATEGGWQPRPGLFTLLGGLRLGHYMAAVALWCVLVFLVSVRWMVLLRAAGVACGLLAALRLNFIGFFFNHALPGLTGGDLARAWLIAKTSDRRAAAAMTVVVDRVIGLFALLCLAALVSRFATDPETVPAGFYQVARGIYLVVGGAVLGSAIYLSSRMRRLLGIEALLLRLPTRLGDMVRKVDGGITLYRGHVGSILFAFLLSLLLQTCGVVSFLMLGRALADALAWQDYFVIVPVVQTLSSVPVAPGGWGVGETLFGEFFRLFGSTLNIGVAVSILFRLTQLLFGLAGGLVWVASKERREGGIAVKEMA